MRMYTSVRDIVFDKTDVYTCGMKDRVFDTDVYICIHRDRCIHLHQRLCLTDTIDWYRCIHLSYQKTSSLIQMYTDVPNTCILMQMYTSVWDCIHLWYDMTRWYICTTRRRLIQMYTSVSDCIPLWFDMTRWYICTTQMYRTTQMQMYLHDTNANCTTYELICKLHDTNANVPTSHIVSNDVVWYTACCLWSVISSFSKLNRWSSSLGLFYHVPLKRDQGDWDWDWRLRLDGAPYAIGCVCLWYRCIHLMRLNDILYEIR